MLGVSICKFSKSNFPMDIVNFVALFASRFSTTAGAPKHAVESTRNALLGFFLRHKSGLGPGTRWLYARQPTEVTVILYNSLMPLLLRYLKLFPHLVFLPQGVVIAADSICSGCT